MHMLLTMCIFILAATLLLLVSTVRSNIKIKYSVRTKRTIRVTKQLSATVLSTVKQLYL